MDWPPAADDDGLARQQTQDEDIAMGAGPQSKHSEMGGYLAFGSKEKDGSERGQQIAELIYALTEDHSAARVSVLRAIAARDGFASDLDLQQLLNNKSGRLVKTSRTARSVLEAMGMAHVLAPVNLLIGNGAPVLRNEQPEWEDIEFEVVLDS